LIQEGSQVLIRAAEKFDHEKAIVFHIATWWFVRQLHARSSVRTIRLRFTSTKPSRIKNNQAAFKKWVKATEEEIATRMEMTIEKLRFIAKSAQLPISLERPSEKEDFLTGRFY